MMASRAMAHKEWPTMPSFGVFLPTFGYPAITMDHLKASAK